MVLVTLLSTIVWAQKGKITLGMDYDILSNQNITYNYYEGDLMITRFEPNVGYFITDNIVVGLGFKSSKNETTDNRIAYNPGTSQEEIKYVDTEERKYNSISPFVKYYHKNLFASIKYTSVNSSYNNDALNPNWLLDTNGVYTFDSFDSYNYLTEEKKSIFTFNLGYQLAYNDKIYFEPSVGVSKANGTRVRKNMTIPNSVRVNQDEEINDLSFGINLSVHIRLGK